MNSPIYPASAQKCRIGSIDHRIDIQGGDVSLNRTNQRRHFGDRTRG